MTTDKPKSPSQVADKFIIRLPDGMREQIATSAQTHNRTMTAEIVWRLQESFSADGSMSATVKQAIQQEAKTSGCSPAQALANLVMAGQTNGGKVLNIRIAPGMTLQAIRDALIIMSEIVPNASGVFIERE